jgi:hypothetical protein
MFVGVFAVTAVALRPGLAVELWRGGLHPCASLKKRLCADLGPTGCQVWQNDLNGAFAACGQSHDFPRNKSRVVDVAIHKLLGWDANREDNSLCYLQLDDAAYAQVLAAVRGPVESRLQTR